MVCYVGYDRCKMIPKKQAGFKTTILGQNLDGE